MHVNEEEIGEHVTGTDSSVVTTTVPFVKALHQVFIDDLTINEPEF
jgi:hypothetical protein